MQMTWLIRFPVNTNHMYIKFHNLAGKLAIDKISLNESEFRWLQNEDTMANDKLSEGIKKFAADAIKLEGVIKDRLRAKK